MLKREEIETPTSCLNKSQDDEPIFVLCARDKLAPEVIRKWACMLIVAATATKDRVLANRQHHKAAEAFELAGRMEGWQARNHAKVPD